MPYPLVFPRDAAGHVWYGESEGDIGEINPDGTLTESGFGSVSVSGVTTGPDGAVWFLFESFSGGVDSSYVGRLAPNGTLTTFALPSAPDGFFQPRVLVSAADGFLYAQLYPSSYVARISTSGAVSYIQVPSPVGDLIRGPDGAAWFSSHSFVTTPAGVDAYTNGIIGQLGPSGITKEFSYIGSTSVPETATGIPDSMTVGRDGRIWFAEILGNKQNSYVGAVTTTGRFSFYPIPKSSTAEEQAIAVGPDSNVWVLTADGQSIVEVSYSGAVVAQRSVVAPFRLVAHTRMALGPDGRMWLNDDRHLYTISLNGTQTTAEPPASTVAVCGVPPWGTPGRTIAVTGRSLDQTTSVTVAGTAAAFTAVSPIQLDVTVPTTVAPGDTTLVVYAGTASSQGTFDTEVIPTISSVSPNCGSPAGGDVVQIQGTELDSIQSATVGGKPASNINDFHFHDETSAWITTPRHLMPGTVDILVTNFAGTSSAVAADRFTYSLNCL